MKDYTVNLTLIDKMILESYKTMLEGLSSYLGNGYELVLHSLESIEHSVIKITNGYHTDRAEGAPITDLALDMLGKIQEDAEKEYITYFTKNKKGEQIKAATLAIRGEGNKIIGLLCMNFYLNTELIDILSNYISGEKSIMAIKHENFATNIDDLVQSAVETARAEIEKDLKFHPSLRNKQIVKQLYKKGIFDLKDSVLKVADCMGISKNTVYMHLRNIHEEEL
ncbi:MAG TPA: hypothetical protein DIC60_09980 [Lachnospiraceae bacterium]|nr:hypothetical protein [Lachnospiraceae bacterium]